MNAKARLRAGRGEGGDPEKENVRSVQRTRTGRVGIAAALVASTL
jgi:hypothetical protein